MTCLFPEFVLPVSSIRLFEILHISYWLIRSEFRKDLSKNFVIFSAHSFSEWDHNSQYWCIIHIVPYSHAPIQSNITMKMKILKRWNRDIHRTFKKKIISRNIYSWVCVLSLVKYNRIRNHRELGRSNFWKNLFPWSDRRDQKRAWKLSENWINNLQTEFSRHKYFLFIFGRENRDLIAATWHPVYFWKKSSWETAWLVSDWFCKRVLQMSAEKVLIFSRNIQEKSFKHRHFTHQIAFSRNYLVPIWSDFWSPKFLRSDYLDLKLIFKLWKSWIRNMLIAPWCDLLSLNI